VLGQFSENKVVAIRRFEKFMLADVNDSILDKLVKGNEGDSRLLCSDQFTDKVLYIKTSLKPKYKSLDALVTELCIQEGITLEQLRAHGKNRKCTKIRAFITFEAQEHNLANLSQTAVYLNRDSSSLSKGIAKYKITKYQNPSRNKLSDE
jgi:hypothetical protein